MDEDDDSDGVNAALARFGLPAQLGDRPTIIAALEEQIRAEAKWAGNSLLTRLLCGLLFTLGVAEDSLRVWRAKTCNFDTHFGVDVTLLCGAGLEETKAFLAAVDTEDAVAALEYLRWCEASGDFAGFQRRRGSGRTAAVLRWGTGVRPPGSGSDGPDPSN